MRSRLIEYIKKNQLSIYQFAKQSKIPESTIRSIIKKEDYEMREGNILKICEGMRIEPYEMFCRTSDELVILERNEIPVMTEYRKLNQEDRCRVQGYMDALIESYSD